VRGAHFSRDGGIASVYASTSDEVGMSMYEWMGEVMEEVKVIP
jgi:hypothetical protein